jgi:UDP-N-acetylglucosamine transferase subunit ALG13
MSRHQQQLTLVHKHQQDLESRLRNMASLGAVPRPVATALQEQLAKSSTELELAERHLRELERHYFAARTWLEALLYTLRDYT